MGRRVVVAALASVLAAAVLALPAVGAPPTVERIEVDETSPDEFLTEACGFPVTTHMKGHLVVIESGGEGTGLVAVRTANGKTYRFRDVGADQVRRTPDGYDILMIIGQLPFGFTGVLKVNETTGEVVLEPQHSTESDLEDACAALAPA
jgi:hypothetical protein